jgi:6-phosphogluconolactonase (cycloisomerase 2 family)
MNASSFIYVQSNDAQANEVLAYGRAEDGSLSPAGSVATGGRGTGVPHLASQGSLALTGDGRHLLVVNAGSDDVSLLAVESGGLRLVDRVASGGSAPTSVAVAGMLVYVLNNGSASIAGFRIVGERLIGLDGSRRGLSSPEADPAQIAFSRDLRTLGVTERGTDSITTFEVDARGYAQAPLTIPSSGKTPYGFDFTRNGAMVVTEAFGGAVGQAAASSYTLRGARLAPVSASVGDTRSEVCWAAVTRDGRFAYVTNFGDGTISSYAIAADGTLTLREAVAGSTRLGEKGVRDEAITRDGRHLYAIDADSGQLFGWEIDADGRLISVGASNGLPATVAGLAAS